MVNVNVNVALAATVEAIRALLLATDEGTMIVEAARSLAPHALTKATRKSTG